MRVKSRIFNRPFVWMFKTSLYEKLEEEQRIFKLACFIAGSMENNPDAEWLSQLDSCFGWKSFCSLRGIYQRFMKLPTKLPRREERIAARSYCWDGIMTFGAVCSTRAALRVFLPSFHIPSVIISTVLYLYTLFLTLFVRFIFYFSLIFLTCIGSIFHFTEVRKNSSQEVSELCFLCKSALRGAS